MSKLQLSVAVGNYDRVRPLIDGAVQIDGVMHEEDDWNVPGTVPGGQSSGAA